MNASRSADCSSRSLLSRFRSLPVLLAGLMLLVSARPADAQQWRQTTRILAEMETGRAPRAFLDSLATRLRKSDTLKIRRSKDMTAAMTAQALSDTLLEKGLGFQSANRVIIDYEFEVVDNELIEEIQGMQFLYRPPSRTEGDVPIMYVETDRPMMQDLMRTSGIPDKTNLSTVHYFVDELSFPTLSINQDIEVVSIAGQTVRGEFDQHRRVLFRQLRSLIYSRDKLYSTQVIGQS